jgi:hypothetical protein
VEADGWARQYVASPTVFAGADHDLDTITLVRGQQFSGVVLDHDGRPRANVPVEIGPWVNIRAHTSLHTGPNWTVLTDADGRFRTPQLPVGRMGAVVRLPERRHGVVGGWVPPGDGEESLPTIHLQKDRPITVTVVDDDGKPIPGAEATWGGTNVTVKTDAQGHLVLRGFGPEAHFQLNVWKENYTFSGEGYVNPPEQLTITLKRAGWIEGRAVDADTGAAVRLKGCMLCQFDRDKDGNVVRRG